jgi:protein-L-isoaspartate O-methyltransferase
MSRVTLRVIVLVIAATVLAGSGALSAQVKEYDWYPEFRRWMQANPYPTGQRSPEAAAERYGEKLKTDGVPAEEIQRRVTLLRTKRQELENDFWNRFFTIDKATFNAEPNAFLASVVEGRKPGTALDVGMGEGRNALFLAKLGWDVTGFDPADQAVALAQKRATSLNLKLRTVIALDTQFDFGRERWDLIVYSWVSPTGSAAKVIESLRPGGIVVVEAGRGWFSPNALLKMFDPLRIVHYEDRVAPSDFFNRREMPIVRLVAEKPRTP